MTTPEMDHRVAELLTHLAGGLTEPMQATLQGPVHAVRYEASTEHNALGYVDREGFEGFAVQYAQETKGMSELEDADVRGSELVSMLYTYRSIARALPTVKGDSDAHKRAMYSASFEVLHPYISRIKQVMYFKDDIVGKFCSNLEQLVRVEAKKKSDGAAIPCEGLMMQLLSALDMLVVLDSLKDTKACLNNDFASYKRAFQLCRADIPSADQITQENNLLQPFLANKESLISSLKSAVQKVPGHEAVLAAMGNLCIECLEQEWYLLPSEKYRLLRGSVYCIWLMDTKGGLNAFKHKAIKKERFAKYFKRHPVVPLYGDMHANLQELIRRCPNFSTVDETDWLSVSKKDAERVAQVYDIIAHLPRLRVLVAEYIGSLNELLHRVASMGGGERCRLPRDKHTELAMRLTWCVLRGCRLMSLANAQLMEFVAWKGAHFVSADKLEQRAGKEAAKTATEYEKALRYNLSDAERSAAWSKWPSVQRRGSPPRPPQLTLPASRLLSTLRRSHGAITFAPRAQCTASMPA